MLKFTWYKSQNPDVSEAGVSPFLHYIKYGLNENRILWEPNWYKKLPIKLEEKTELINLSYNNPQIIRLHNFDWHIKNLKIINRLLLSKCKLQIDLKEIALYKNEKKIYLTDYDEKLLIAILNQTIVIPINLDINYKNKLKNRIILSLFARHSLNMI